MFDRQYQFFTTAQALQRSVGYSSRIGFSQIECSLPLKRVSKAPTPIRVDMLEDVDSKRGDDDEKKGSDERLTLMRVECHIV